MLKLAAAAAGVGQSVGEPSPAGSYTFRFSTRTFQAPLFGASTTGIFHLLGHQALREQGSLTLWVDSGFPNSLTEVGAEWQGLPFASGEATLSVGDFLLKPLLPQAATPVSADFYALRGAGLEVRAERNRWRLFAGDARRFRQLPGGALTRPELFGGSYLRRRGASHFGLSLVGVSDPTFVGEGDEHGTTAVVSGNYFHELSPWMGLFGEVLGGDRGAVGARVGSRLQFQNGDLVARLYAFGDRFPLVDPLYRPGERGLELASRFRLSDELSLSGYVDFTDDPKIDRSASLRAEAGLHWSLGGRRPSLFFRYGRNQITYESTSIAGPGVTADRLVFGLNRSGVDRLLDLSVEHLLRASDGRERSQAIIHHRRALGTRKLLDSDLVLQRQDRAAGVTAESTLELPLGGPYSLLTGLGAAFVDRESGHQGEGVFTAGVSRRLTGDGLSARVELVVPFDLGLPRSALAGRQLAFDFGHRFSWRDLGSLRAVLPGRLGGASRGTIEGRVLLAGAGLERVTIFVDGEPRATTGRDGSFRVRRVPEGTRTVHLDLRELDPRLTAQGGSLRRVEVAEGRITPAVFELEEMSYLQGSLVRCAQEEELLPVVGAVLALRGEELSYNLRTRSHGEFSFDRILPGIYELVIDPGSLDPEIDVRTPLRWPRIDLRRDLGGVVLRINCRDPGSP